MILFFWADTPVFEGQRAYGGEIFKLTEHSERLCNSAGILGFEIPYSVEDIDQACLDVMQANNLSDCYIRPIAWRGSEQMGVSAQKNRINLAVAAWDWGSYFPIEERLKGIRLAIAEYRRPDPATAPVHAKAAGLYMICTIEKHRAEAAGYNDALHYASSVFEGQRAYGGRIFKLTEHSERLRNSAEILGFEIPYSVEEISQACIDAMQA